MDMFSTLFIFCKKRCFIVKKTGYVMLLSNKYLHIIGGDY